MSIRVSVCMATFNGEKFITEQLTSVMGQLGQSDELVVVDDCSTDNTAHLIETFGDPRIQLIRHSANQGVVASFENAIQSASGEFIFLCDQDDLWAPGKVDEFVATFRSHPEVSVVVSDARLIGHAGETIAESNFINRRFRPGLVANLLHSRYIGCMMAFRSSLLPKILPFPRELDVLHDIWIGTKNHVTGGKTFFIDKPLTYYRRHGGNATGVSRLTWKRRLRLRFDLLRALIRSNRTSAIAHPTYTRSA
jgi:glycosyltransferase involved in cell wall biosynthesis